jgi:uncharacterized protein (DUF1501 family)
MKIYRRVFPENGGITISGNERHVGVPPVRHRRAAVSGQEAIRGALPARRHGRPKRRGPFRSAKLLPITPQHSIPQPSRGTSAAAIDLNGSFGFHPSLAPLLPLYRQRHLVVVHAAGSPDLPARTLMPRISWNHVRPA